MKKKLAIIGASTGQLPLCLKAKELGLETFCFAWPQGAVCKDYVDHFVPVSIFEMDIIVDYCRKWNVDGVVSNASESTALVVSYVAEKLGKVCTPYQVFKNIQNKFFVRRKTNKLPELSKVNYVVGKYEEIMASFSPPYVLKPIIGAAKKGVNFVNKVVSELAVPDDLNDTVFIGESYIDGLEYSVEAISYSGQHQVVQITEKMNTGAPHFVELGHQQPAPISLELEEKVKTVVPKILSELGFTNGASHTEIKINSTNEIYLIEVNPRGGGDEISNTLVQLSTGFDYLKGMIEVALDEFVFSPILQRKYAGIYYLCRQSADWFTFFKETDFQPWLIKKEMKISSIMDLHSSSSNYDRDGFILYQWNKRISPDQHSFLSVRKLNLMPNKFELGKNFVDKMKEELQEHCYDIPNDWLRKILNKGDVLVYMNQDEICGWLVLYCNDFQRKYAYIASVHTLMPFRGKGIAKILMESAIDICENRDFDVIGLYCNNPMAMRFYSKYGFKEIHRRPEEQYGGEIYSYMELRLAN